MTKDDEIKMLRDRIDELEGCLEGLSYIEEDRNSADHCPQCGVIWGNVANAQILANHGGYRHEDDCPFTILHKNWERE